MNHSQQKAAIDALFLSLDQWGLLYARSKLRDLALKFSGLEDLPPEIICSIASCLRLSDIFNCCLVSQSWYQSFTHCAVLIALCRHLFPGLRETCPSVGPKQLLINAASNYLKWHQLGYNAKFIPWDPSWSTDHFKNETPRGAQQLPDADNKTIEVVFAIQYTEGLLAWQPNHDMIILDDLQTRTRRRCAFGLQSFSGRRLQIEGLSRQLAVFAGTGSNPSVFNIMSVSHLLFLFEAYNL